VKELKRNDLEQMTRDQLMELAQERFGVQLDSRAKKEDMVENTLALQDQHISQESDGAEEAPSRGEQNVETRAERVEVTLHSDEAPGGDQAHPVGVNGKVWTIPRDKPVLVPREVAEVLENAKQGVVERDPSAPNGEVRYRERQTGRFALTIRE
jgi:hypothetical protein